MVDIQLRLSYQPPYRWDLMLQFLRLRLIETLEWIDGDSYGRTFSWCVDERQIKGYFEVTHLAAENGFDIKLYINEQADLVTLVKNIRRVLDLDTDLNSIEQQLAQLPGFATELVSGLRLPGIWQSFEAGIRAVLGQQISVVAAKKLVTQVVQNYGEEIDVGMVKRRLFPTPQVLAEVDFALLKIPQSRRNTLIALSEYCAANPEQDDLDQWLKLKGVGPWTVNYAKMRGQSDHDIWLGSDLGVSKALNKLAGQQAESVGAFNPDAAKPWRSYLTFQCWSLL